MGACEGCILYNGLAFQLGLTMRSMGVDFVSIFWACWVIVVVVCVNDKSVGHVEMLPCLWVSYPSWDCLLRPTHVILACCIKSIGLSTNTGMVSHFLIPLVLHPEFE